jgi:hypothetical protein
MKRTSKAKVAELIALEACVILDLQVAIPFSGQAGWDFLIRENGPWLSVQVKTVHERKGSPCVETRKGGGYDYSSRSRKYCGYEFDILLAVRVETGEIWRLDITECCNRRSISLSQHQVWAKV